MDQRDWRGPALALLLLLPGCSSGSGSSSSTMAIVGCSLGCTGSGGSGEQFSCGVTDVYVNQEIRIQFSNEVALSSVNNNSFQVVEVESGKTPPGTFELDSVDPTILIYRPQLTFDSSGNPIFGLTEDKTYNFKVPGSALDELGPYVQNSFGQPNTSRLQCTLRASRGIFDANPGQPTVQIKVQPRDPATGMPEIDPMTGEPVFLCANAGPTLTDISKDTVIRLEFDDIMNPATLANPVTGESGFICIKIDPDGDVSDPTDQVPLRGTFTITLDQNALRTTVVFRPEGGLPSAGADLQNPRLVVVELPATIADLGGNPLQNFGSTFFAPEAVLFAEQTISETFDDQMFEDGGRSSQVFPAFSNWSGGRLIKGPSGGSGRLGDLIVPTGRTVTLRTDSEDFSDSEFTNPEVFNKGNVIEIGDPTTFTVDGGLFEFARLRVDAGGTLRLIGPNPARLLVRGEAFVFGRINVAGVDAVLHDAFSLNGGVGGEAGAGGGDGGDGGLRPDGSNFPNANMGEMPEGGVPNPPAAFADMAATMDPAAYVPMNGGDGGGIPFPNTIMEMTRVANGQGGLAWPQPTAMFPGIRMPFDETDVFAFPLEPLSFCSIFVVSGAGAGGAHAISGKQGIGGTGDVGGADLPVAPLSVPGDSEDLAIDDLVKSLEPDLGLLRGGGGGGGGGSHLFLTATNGNFVNGPCTVVQGGTDPAMFTQFRAASAAAGGGGGGGVQVQSGNRVILNGVIDASGGDGGSGGSGGGFSDLAQAGGGGAGGAVLLQGPLVQIQAVPNRINVSGGFGGFGPLNETNGSPPSTGGGGGAGFLRLESFGTPPSVATEMSKVLPSAQELADRYGATIDDIFTTDVWTPPTTGPSSFSGAQSCWFQPTGNFFELNFLSDDPPELGWDMNVLFAIDDDGDGQRDEDPVDGIDNDMDGMIDEDPVLPPQSYRGENDLFPFPLDDPMAIGNVFGGSAIVVRFQGARALGPLLDACDTPLSGLESPIVNGSLSPWVEHPDELSGSMIPAAVTPNIIRFTVLWDSSQPLYEDIVGISDISIRVQPD